MSNNFRKVNSIVGSYYYGVEVTNGHENSINGLSKEEYSFYIAGIRDYLSRGVDKDIVDYYGGLNSRSSTLLGQIINSRSPSWKLK